MYVFKAFWLRGGQTIHFRFYFSKLKPYLSHTLVASEQIAMCFSVENKSLAIESWVWRNIGMHIVPSPCGLCVLSLLSRRFRVGVSN